MFIFDIQNDLETSFIKRVPLHQSIFKHSARISFGCTTIQIPTIRIQKIQIPKLQTQQFQF